MAKGNCSKLNNEMQGKIISAVKGFDPVYAAVAKEPKATRRGTPVQSVVLTACPNPSVAIRTRYEKTYSGNSDLPEHLQLLIIPNRQDLANERVLPGVELDTKNNIND